MDMHSQDNRIDRKQTMTLPMSTNINTNEKKLFHNFDLFWHKKSPCCRLYYELARTVLTSLSELEKIYLLCENLVKNSLTMVYTLAERIEMIFIYGAENRCALRADTTFNVRHPDQNVSHTYVRQLILRFEETESIANKKRTVRRVTNEAVQLEV
ncbi:transposable element tc3 transposase [Lasius niger]|uniref:Transposable element tc3 transposase n=1 Tax=Lasius niger TaxID=67767 RepID=A0A0J7K718_LASNI|nr:transposable element tc3 transposase [Lasius niger]